MKVVISHRVLAPRTQILAPDVSRVGLALAGKCIKLASFKLRGERCEMRVCSSDLTSRPSA